MIFKIHNESHEIISYKEKGLELQKMLSNADQVQLSHFTDRKRRLSALSKNVSIS